jgi:hypothetical protein
MKDLFKINTDKQDDSIQYTYYTILGSNSSIDSNNNPIAKDKKSALAYTKVINNEDQHYIKVGLYGKIFNPIGMYSEGRQNKFLSKIGKQEYNFTRVNSKVFDMYLNFLRTKNVAWLNNAERELR